MNYSKEFKEVDLKFSDKIGSKEGVAATWYLILHTADWLKG
jgi:hypothetical protein